MKIFFMKIKLKRLNSGSIRLYIIRRYYKTNFDTPHFLYTVGGASKVSERFQYMAKGVIEFKGHLFMELICLNILMD